MTILTKPIILKIYLLFWVLLLSSSTVLFAQQKPGWDTIKTSEVLFFKSIQQETGLYLDKQAKPDQTVLSNLPVLEPVGSNYTKRIPSSFVGKPVYLQFTVKNDLDTVTSVYFLPGMYFEDIDLFRINSKSGTLEPEPEYPGEGIFDPNVVSKLILQPGETATFVTKLAFIKTTINTITPTLSFDHFLPTLLTELQNERKINTIISFLVCGIMLMMIFYSLAEFYINRNRVFLYYSAYAILLGIMFFSKPICLKRQRPRIIFLNRILILSCRPAEPFSTLCFSGNSHSPKPSFQF